MTVNVNQQRCVKCGKCVKDCPFVGGENCLPIRGGLT